MYSGQAKGEIAKRFEQLHQERLPRLEQARDFARLTMPALLPPEGHDEQSYLPDTFADDGASGVANLSGRLKAAIFPGMMPWFHLDLSPELALDPNATPEAISELKNLYATIAVLVETMLETDTVQGNSRNRRPRHFHTRQLEAIKQVLVTGDVLQYLTDDFRVINYRQDRYVVVRNEEGDLIDGVLCRNVDPLSLPAEHFDEAFTTQELEKFRKESDPKKRMTKLFTRFYWDPESSRWKVSEETNGRVFNEYTEAVAPFWTVSLGLVSGESYGRSYCENVRASLYAVNELEEYALDGARLASYHRLGIDIGCNVTNEDLAAPVGAPLRGVTVRGGQVQDVGLMQFAQLPNVSHYTAILDRHRSFLNRHFLVESEIQPQQERVTAMQVARIAQELEGVLGGLYAPMAEGLQLPMVRRAFELARRQKLLNGIIPGIRFDDVEFRALTGYAALSAASEAQAAVEVAQVAQQLGDTEVINTGEIIRLINRRNGSLASGVTYTDEQVRKRREEQMRQQNQQLAQQQLAQQAIASAGGAVDGAIAQEQAQQAAPPEGTA